METRAHTHMHTRTHPRDTKAHTHTVDDARVKEGVLVRPEVAASPG